MLLLFKLALRNLSRNRLRTILNLTMVIGAFTAVLLFKGFAHYMLVSLEASFTEGQNGHIQIAKKAIWDGETLKNKEEGYVENYQEIKDLFTKNSQIKYSGGRANAYVLLSNGDYTVGATALGFEPQIETNIEKNLHITEGSGFSGNQAFEVLVGAGLQKQLHLKVGQTLTVISQTLAGSMSSIEPEVRGVVNSGLTETDNSTIYLPLTAAQKLLGTPRVERVAILLNENTDLLESTKQVKELLKDRPDLVIKDWKETATFFRQVADFYAIQNLLVEVILSILVFFGILNTVGMSIYERIGEIGTMRALGDQKIEVLTLLLLEGLLIGIIGAALATPFSFLIALGVSSLQLPLMMPGASLPMPIEIIPSWSDYLDSTIVVCLTCLISTFWPAFKAVRLSIVDALRANS